jgi:hypothetical protein
VRDATRALAGARGQGIKLASQQVAEMIIAELAAGLLQFDQRLQVSTGRSLRRGAHQAMTIESMPGFGPILGDQLLVAGGDLRAYPAPAIWPRQPAWCRSPPTLADDPAHEPADLRAVDLRGSQPDLR